VQGRFVGRQFDDDQNLLPLASFFTVDAHVSRQLSSHVTLFAAGQNLTGVRYVTARTPVVSVGPSVLYRMGLRLMF
jgi:outer membrane receptor protein involved in Fe transport